MLTGEVKSRINTCRDILVGKLPDPKSQVLQITNALIYKFMDDQDRMAEKLGGKAEFFVKDLKPYAWHRLFDSKLSNQERADKYIEGLTKLSQSNHLPDLFREIFKEAYMPFRAAGTIVMFLDEINKFDYTHSEELGNAYEYLLSIMGSQGDAGQFRTPRHIIEFIVDVVDPKKNETIYDPACGTAGFLISAYNHIREANKKLTAAEQHTLSQNIQGIDISPDMAKMARVNLYLHGFATPHIEEGDTLTDEELWGTKYDVIFANPPFMSPKGGIQPHKKFSVKAKRSEVLFVDYIAEHLKLKGRAGIIVPEGIIFQSKTAYKDLRKMLVEDNYLHSVVSLPSGVFQPYAGVKTSILILDREKAKETDEILFIKIENDGFALGAQRTSIDGSQLPEALEVVKAWEKNEKKEGVSFASWVTKEEIAESGDYNLTGGWYRSLSENESSCQLVELAEVAKIKNGFAFKSSEYVNQGHRIIRIANVQKGKIVDVAPKYIDSSRVNKEFSGYELFTGDILMSLTGNVGRVAKLEASHVPALLNQRVAKIIPVSDVVSADYIYHILNSEKFIADAILNAGGVAQPNLSSKWVEKYRIPFPPLNIQKEIVAELDRYQKVIDGAKQVVKNYKPSFTIDQSWAKKKVGDVCDVINGGTPSRTKKEYWYGDIPWISSKYFTNDHKILDSEFITTKGLKESASKVAPKGSTILITRVSVGKFAYADRPYALNQDLTALVPKTKKLRGEFLYLVSSLLAEKIKNNAQGVGVTGVTKNFVLEQEIPLPPVEIQERIVKSVNFEKDIIDGNKKLIEIFEQKIKDKLSEVWGE